MSDNFWSSDLPELKPEYLSRPQFKDDSIPSSEIIPEMKYYSDKDFNLPLITRVMLKLGCLKLYNRLKNRWL